MIQAPQGLGAVCPLGTAALISSLSFGARRPRPRLHRGKLNKASLGLAWLDSCAVTILCELASALLRLKECAPLTHSLASTSGMVRGVQRALRCGCRYAQCLSSCKLAIKNQQHHREALLVGAQVRTASFMPARAERVVGHTPPCMGAAREYQAGCSRAGVASDGEARGGAQPARRAVPPPPERLCDPERVRQVHV